MKRLVYLLPLGVFMVLAIYFAVGLTKDPRKLPSVLINTPVPEFDLVAIQGRDRGFSSKDLKGEVSLVNVFGSWCVACQVEHPFLMKLAKQKLVPVHAIDWREVNRTAGPAWLKKYGDPYTLIGDDPRSKGAIAFGVTGAPETFLIDAEGVIRYKYIGPLSQQSWDETIWPIIQKLRQTIKQKAGAKS
ncbi:MAG: DsbE family thiol:disulfide interchange protein [Rhodospirillaceae bacterium]|nr:DsbE family thiol:disulfide interchange protein [Rhodospirillaceae bacterium]MBT5036537.1 DsbE family thiol:disulfide interchange protein [Rhodospirillaceae bacterium]MBT6220028.1 DsbE family thiol:disulfide interchange protein [Rhodospirillaceae bacterium]